MMKPALATLLLAVCLLGGCKGGEQSDLSMKQMLARLQGPTPTESVEKAFDVEDPDKAREGILELSSHDWGLREPHLKGYATILNLHEHPTVRSAAVTALGKAADLTYAPNVIKALETDPSEIVRCDAALALANLPGEATDKALVDHALSLREAPQVRAACAKSLGGSTSRTTLVSLVRCLEDPSGAVRYRAHESLVARTGMDMGMQASDWRGVEKFPTDTVQYKPEKTYAWWDLRRWGWGSAPAEPETQPSRTRQTPAEK